MSSLLTFGSWIIDVDFDRTNLYYQNYTLPDENQIYRNYCEFCKNMFSEEKNFFESLSLNPLYCNPISFGLTKEKTIPTFANFFIAGKYINCPKEELLTPTEILSEDYVDLSEKRDVQLGRLSIEFQDPNAIFHTIPDNLPEGFLCFTLWVHELPWLLKEKCNSKMYYPPKSWHIIKIAKEKINGRMIGKAQYMEYLTQIKEDLEEAFYSAGINFTLLNTKQQKDLRSHWISSFLPNKTHSELKKFYIHGNKEYSNYLWHAFSYELLPSKHGEEAQSAFQDTPKLDCYILFNNDNLAYELQYCGQLKVELIDQYDDILVFDKAFTWCYTHTHEQYCGPYFYSSALSRS